MFQISDREILKGKEFRNTLESYAYDMRSNLEDNGDLAPYVEQATRASYLEQVGQVVEWLYTQEGEKARISDYQERYNFFKSINEPIRERKEFFSQIDIYLK